MRKEILPYPKTKQTGREPKLKQSNKAKGTGFEKEIQQGFQKLTKEKVQRNHQGGVGGGISRPDISFGKFNIEAKNTEDLEIPKWLRNIIKETPPEKIPGLVFSCLGRKWLTIPFEAQEEHAFYVIEQKGGTVEFSYLSDLA